MFATKKQTFKDKIQTGSATMKTGNGLFFTQKSRYLLKRQANQRSRTVATEISGIDRFIFCKIFD